MTFEETTPFNGFLDVTGFLSEAFASFCFLSFCTSCFAADNDLHLNAGVSLLGKNKNWADLGPGEAQVGF